MSSELTTRAPPRLPSSQASSVPADRSPAAAAALSLMAVTATSGAGYAWGGPWTAKGRMKPVPGPGL